VDIGFGTPPASVSGTWTATPRSLLNPRPLGNTPLDLSWSGGPLPTPTYHASQRIYSNAWVYDTWTRRMGGGELANGIGWNFKARVTPPPGGMWAQQEPYPTTIQAIQISIRLWDRKTNQTRQVTIIQEM
jgi:hypothetical protein